MKKLRGVKKWRGGKRHARALAKVIAAAAELQEDKFNGSKFSVAVKRDVTFQLKKLGDAANNTAEAMQKMALKWFEKEVELNELENKYDSLEAAFSIMEDDNEELNNISDELEALEKECEILPKFKNDIDKMDFEEVTHQWKLAHNYH